MTRSKWEPNGFLGIAPFGKLLNRGLTIATERKL
jgi:hypothetical protein